MCNVMNPRRQRLCGVILLGFCMATANGCAMLPPLIEHGYTVISGISYLATSKGPSDHALSMMAKKDCSLLRILRGQPVCMPITENTNRTLIATLRETFAGQPRDLSPAELLKQLPEPPGPALPLDSVVVASD